jgi:sulfoxide reductase heme-binding subunit YedZ
MLRTFSIGTGYVGLWLILATLVIGPLKLLKVRKNPVNLNSRRDIGIWAGITSLAHVVFSIALQFSWGGSLMGFFFYQDGTPKFNLFGVSNGFGLVGALVVLFLLILSNNYFLKRLKGKNWKKLQRFNYLLFVVALVHTITQQVNVGRNPLLTFGVIALATGVVAAQSIGFVIYRRRSEQRKNTTVLAAKPENIPDYYNPAPARPMPKLAMYGVVGLLSAFIGFVLAGILRWAIRD